MLAAPLPTRCSRRIARSAPLLLLPLLLSGCGSLWSPSPPPPTPEEVERMRQEMAERTRPVSADGPADGVSPSDRPAITDTRPPAVRPLAPYPTWSMDQTAADALGRIGAPAVPELIRALSSDDPKLRQRAAAVLGRIGPDAAPAVPELIRLLDDPDPAVRQTAARTLGQIGPRAAAAVPALIERMD